MIEASAYLFCLLADGMLNTRDYVYVYIYWSVFFLMHLPCLFIFISWAAWTSRNPTHYLNWLVFSNQFDIGTPICSNVKATRNSSNPCLLDRFFFFNHILLIFVCCTLVILIYYKPSFYIFIYVILCMENTKSCKFFHTHVWVHEE